MNVQKQMNLSLEDLPVECFSVVCSFLGNVSDFSNLRLVSSNINRIVIHPDFNGSVNAKATIEAGTTIKKASTKCEIYFVKNLILLGFLIPLVDLCVLLKRFPRLLSIRIPQWRTGKGTETTQKKQSGFKPNEKTVSTSRKLPIFRSLHNLSIPTSLLTHISNKGLENLIQLSLSNNEYEITIDVSYKILQLARVSRKLKVFRIDGFKYPSFNLPEYIQLEEFEVKNCSCDLGETFLSHPTRQTLKTLKLIRRKLDVSISLILVSDKPFTNLEFLKIQGIHINSNHLNRVTLPKLEHLHMYKVPKQMSEKAIEFSNLKSLSVCLCGPHFPPKPKSSYKEGLQVTRHHHGTLTYTVFKCEDCSSCGKYHPSVSSSRRDKYLPYFGGGERERGYDGVCERCSKIFCKKCSGPEIDCFRCGLDFCKSCELKACTLGPEDDFMPNRIYCSECEEKCVTECQHCKIEHSFVQFEIKCKYCDKYICWECRYKKNCKERFKK